VDYWVKDVEVTELKGPLVSGKIPSVAKHTQGEVVKFVTDAVTKLAEKAGKDVIIEGRAETVDFVPSLHRFSLEMEDGTAIGARRAAQRVAGEFAKAAAEGKEGAEEVGEDACRALLEEIVGKMQ